MPLEIWFLNVGHGDCTVVKFPSGHMAMIDINNARALDEQSGLELAMSMGRLSEGQYLLRKALGQGIEVVQRYEELLEDPVDFWLNNFKGEELFRFILTHPDMDHLSGLYRLTAQEPIPLLNFWDTNHTKEMSEEDCQDSPYDYRDWQQYQILRQSEGHPKVLRLQREDEGSYWKEDGMTLLLPTPELEEKAQRTEEWNHLSYVLRIQHGDSVVILTGDPSVEALQDLHDHFSAEFLAAGLFSAPHHGRDSGYYQPLVQTISPKYTIVSVGKKPETDASNKYRQYSEHVYSTRFHGTLQAQCWPDGGIWLYDHNGERLPG